MATGEGWDVYKRVGTRRITQCTFTQVGHKQEKPIDCWRADIESFHAHNMIRCTGVAPTTASQNIYTPTIQNEIALLGPAEKYLIQNIQTVKGTIHELAADLQEGKVVTVSDGSYNPTTEEPPLKPRSKTQRRQAS